MTIGVGSPKFVVSCPKCAVEDRQGVQRGQRARDTCALCHGHRQVSRRIAEQFELELSSAVSRRF
jgi:hypothetical protein